MEVICEPQNIAKVLRSDSHIVQTRSIDHIDTIYSQLNKERSEKKSEDSMVSRIIKLAGSEPSEWSAVPPPLTKADIQFC